MTHRSGSPAGRIKLDPAVRAYDQASGPANSAISPC